MSPPAAHVLRGRDLTELGPIEVAEPTERVALALTAGDRPKDYPHTDPNEDAVGALCDGGAVVLACADGHNGAVAAEIAVEYVLERLGPEPPDEIPSRRWVEIFWRTGETVLARARESEESNRDSSTTLVVALLRGRRLDWASVGDSSLLVGSAGGVRELARGEMLFVGWPMSPDEVEGALSCGTDELDSDDWVILATDGFAEFAEGGAEEAARSVLEDGGGAAEIARKLVDAAFAGGAGDNVGIALAAPQAAA